MVAATPQSSFGFSETKLAPDRYEVRYVTPALSLPADSKARARWRRRGNAPMTWPSGARRSWRSPAASASSASAPAIAIIRPETAR